VLKDLEDSLDGINAALKSEHAPSYNERAHVFYDRLQEFGTQSDTQKTAMAAAASGAQDAGGMQSAAGVFAKGGYLPGDEDRAAAEDVQPTLAAGEYTGFFETMVKKGDTIQSLAQQHLGDPGLWLAIAVINNLKSPFLSGGSVRKFGTMAVGDPIAIPTNTPSGAINNAATGNASAGGSQIDAAMGVDLRVVKLPNGKYGWGEDSTHGGTGGEDVQAISGVNNLVQALEARMRREQGEDPHFPNCGLPRLVGNDAIGQTFREARFAMEVQLLQDPRIEAVERLEFDLAGDVLEISADARIVGLDSSRTIPVSVS
jgi:hypothetical protein